MIDSQVGLDVHFGDELIHRAASEITVCCVLVIMWLLLPAGPWAVLGAAAWGPKDCGFDSVSSGEDINRWEVFGN